MSESASVVSNRGVRSPRLLYGTAWKKSQTAELVQLALDYGFRGIDTACQPKHYDEAGVGAGIAGSLDASLGRDDLYLQTKFTPLSGQDPQRIPYDTDAGPAQQIAQSCAVSLHNLRTSYLDCLLLHSPLADFQQTKAAWVALEALVDEGVVRQIGISNCYDLAYFKTLHDSARIKPSVLQNRFHAATGYDIALRAWCREQGVVYQSFWTLTANAALLQQRIVQSLAAAYKCNAEQVLFRYLTQIGVVPLTGTRSVQHMREDLDMFQFELSGEDVTQITRLL